MTSSAPKRERENTGTLGKSLLRPRSSPSVSSTASNDSSEHFIMRILIRQHKETDFPIPCNILGRFHFTGVNMPITTLNSRSNSVVPLALSRVAGAFP